MLDFSLSGKFSGFFDFTCLDNPDFHRHRFSTTECTSDNTSVSFCNISASIIAIKASRLSAIRKSQMPIVKSYTPCSLGCPQSINIMRSSR